MNINEIIFCILELHEAHSRFLRMSYLSRYFSLVERKKKKKINTTDF